MTALPSGTPLGIDDPAAQAACLAAAALVLLLLGHVVRLARWSVLMRQIGRPRLGDGFMALSLGYLIDAAVPLRLGEIVRGLYYARRTAADPAFVIASIVVERVLDLVAVWAITMALLAAGVFVSVPLLPATAAALGVSALVVAAAALTHRSRRFRRLAWRIASVFNARIRILLIDTLWSTAEVFRAGRARWARILAQSVLMWLFYGASFALLAEALGLGVQQVFRAAVGTPLLPMVVPLLHAGGQAALGLVLFSFAPLLLFLAYVGAKQQLGVSVWGAVSWMHEPALYAEAAPRSKSRFVDADLYGDFLARRFAGGRDLVSEFEANALRDIVVQRMLRGGSDALTVMVQLEDKLCIRKFAVDGAAVKLAEQCAWLRRHSNALPVVRVLEQASDGARFYYDMEYSRTSRDLFDMAHTYDTDATWRTLHDVLDTMAGFHEQTRSGLADDACAARYVAEKVGANLRAIKAAAPDFFGDEAVTVNGHPFDRQLLDRFADPDFLRQRLRRRDLATIHGDLTIENILTDPARPGGWFLIDPNVGNVFESPLLDYAKLLQSLHLGYESLNRDLSCSFSGRALSFPIARSAQYALLYERTVHWLRDRFGEDALREIRLHEVVHYFRLTPYKFRKGMQPGLVFLGCLSLLVTRYFDEFEPC